MVQIYSENNTNYDYNGDVTLDPEVCDFHAVLNGSWEVTLECPLDEQNKFQEILTNAILCTDTPVGEKQLFRIYDVERTEIGVIGYARPVFLDSARDVFFPDIRPTDLTGQEALDYLMAGTPYSGYTNISKVSTAYYVRKNLIEALAGNEDNSFLNRWGGEIIYDNYKINILIQQGEDNDLRVEFGTNIQSIKETIDVDEMGTRLVPVAFNGRTLDGNEPWVDSPLIDNYPIVYTKIVEFDDMRLTEDFSYDEDGNPTEDMEDYDVYDTLEELQAAMVERCKQLFVDGIDLPAITYEVDMLDLRRADEYKEYQDLETVNLGDTVYCYHRKLGIETKARVIEYTYDCVRKCITSLVIGDYQEDYLDHLSDITSSSGGTVDFSQIWARLDYLELNALKVGELEAEAAKIGLLTADEADITYARITDLQAALIEVNELIAKEIDAVHIDVEMLDASVANIISLLGGDIATGSLDTIHLTADNAVIDSEVVISALIEEAIIGDLLAGYIYTDYITIMDNENGNMILTGPTIQFIDSDGNYRMQVGLDGAGNFNIYIMDIDGNVLFDALGLTEEGLIGNGAIIRDVAVADDANISGYKLNIQEVATILNADGSLIIDAGQVFINGETLSAVYTEIRQDVDSALTEAEKALEAAGGLVEIGARNYLLNTRDLDYEEDKTVYADSDWELSQDESDFGVLTETGNGSVLMLTAISAEKNSLSGKKMIFAADLFEADLTSILEDYDLEFGIYTSDDDGATWKDYGVINSSMAEDDVFEFNRDELLDNEWCRITAKFTANASHMHTTSEAPVFTWGDDDMTCTVTFTCDSCGETVTENCTITENVDAATCTEDGLITRTASIVIGGVTYSDVKSETIPALGHDWKYIGTHRLMTGLDTPDFEIEGVDFQFVCNRCGEELDVRGDLTLTEKIEPTCTADGSQTYTATLEFEGETHTDVIVSTLPALGHEYGDPTFNWSSDLSSCSATFACTRGDTTTTVGCTIEIVTIPATCENEGMSTYTASVTFDGKTYTDEKTETIPAGAHEYGEPTFTWADDFSSCKAVFVCPICGDTQTVDCTIEKATTDPTCTEEGGTVFTATATFESTTYTDSQLGDITPALGHEYGEPVFNWNDDYSSCEAVFTCARGDDTQTVQCAITVKDIEPTESEEGGITHTATCTFNGQTYSETKLTDTIPALGHEYGEPTFKWLVNINFEYEEGNEIIESGKLGDDVYYDIYDNGLCKVYGSGKMYTYSPMNPAQLSPLYQNSTIETLVIEGSVSSIGDAAFGGITTLTTVDMLSSEITDIGQNAFQNCTSLNNVLFPYTLKSINYYAFNQCTSLSEITFTGNAPYIYSSIAEAFIDVTATCYYPAGDSTWNNFIFGNYGGSLTWEEKEFKYTCQAIFECVNNDDTQIVDCDITSRGTDPTCVKDGSVEYTATCEFNGQTYSDTLNLSVPALGHDYTVEFEWSDDYSECTAIFTCSRGDDVQSMGCIVKYSYTYPSCTEDGAETFTARCVFNDTTYTDQHINVIQAYGHNYGEPVFSWTAESKKVVVDIPYEPSGSIIESGQLGNDVWYDIYENGYCRVYGTGETYAYSSMDTSSRSPLYGNNTIKVLVIEDNITAINAAVFHGASAIEYIYMNNSSVSSIGDNEFQNCTSLKEAFLSPDLATISSRAFYGCTALTEITFIGNAPTSMPSEMGSYYQFVNVTATCFYPADNDTWDDFDFGNYGGNLTWQATEYEYKISGYTCTAAFTCSNCGDTQTVKCTVTSETTGDQCEDGFTTIYTATCEFNGQTYTGVLMDYVEPTGHEYGEPTFDWADDLSSCTATFVCSVCKNIETVNCTVTKSGGTYTATVTMDGKTYTNTQSRNIFAIYCANDTSLTFYRGSEIPNTGDTYDGKVVSEVYTGFEDVEYSNYSNVPWTSYRQTITSVKFDDSVSGLQPISLKYWFYNFRYATFSGLNNIDASKITNMYYAFYGCRELTDDAIEEMSDWDTSSVTNMYSAFLSCVGIVKPSGLTNWTMSNVTNMSYMFSSCSGMTSIDVSKWDTNKVENMSYMFQGCSALKTIYSDDDVFVTRSVTSGNNMFLACNNLVGGNGTAFSSSNGSSYTMAHIDTAENPGYFSGEPSNNFLFNGVINYG